MLLVDLQLDPTRQSHHARVFATGTVTFWQFEGDAATIFGMKRTTSPQRMEVSEILFALQVASSLATSRLVPALLEQRQRPDGSVSIHFRDMRKLSGGLCERVLPARTRRSHASSVGHSGGGSASYAFDRNCRSLMSLWCARACLLESASTQRAAVQFVQHGRLIAST
jgi:hypothetical protein